MTGTRPRIGLLVPRFTLFDPHMHPGFVERMRAAGPRHAAVLGRWFDVVYPGIVETEAEAAAAGAALAAAGVDAIVYAPAMAAPPRLGQVAIEPVDAPVVVWNAVPVDRMAADLDQAEATENSTTVGCTMFGNVLLRLGRPAVAVTAPPGDAEAVERLRRVVTAAAAAGSLRGATLLRVGAPVAGYANVEATADDLAALGLREVDVGPHELAAAMAAVDDPAAILDEVRRAGFGGDPGAEALRSARLAGALAALLDRHGAVAGTVNCHGPLLRFSDDVGITACLGVAREARRGRPLSCTGDMPCAVALHLARVLAGAALYHESYAPEPATGLMLLAAGGEGDPAWADDEGVVMEENDHYPGHHGRGTSIAFRVRRGPATILSMSPVGGRWRLAWATGAVEEARYRGMRGPNGMFRFDHGDAASASEGWILSGATHHSALAPGRLDVELPVVARLLGLDAVRL